MIIIEINNNIYVFYFNLRNKNLNSDPRGMLKFLFSVRGQNMHFFLKISHIIYFL